MPELNNSIPWNQRLDDATATSIEAEENEVKIAIKALCLAARDEYPTAAKIKFDDSDQGAWAVVDDVLDENDASLLTEDDYWDDGWDYASHLYDARRYTWLLPYVVEGTEGHHERSPSRGVVLIDKVLDDLKDL